MGQFFYSRKEPVRPKEGDTELKYETFIDSFNLNCVVRSYEAEKGKLFVLLNDGHEESREVPDYSNQGKQKGVKRERQWIVSQILLEGNDVERFRVVCGIGKEVMVNTEIIPSSQLKLDFNEQ